VRLFVLTVTIDRHRAVLVIGAEQLVHHNGKGVGAVLLALFERPGMFAKKLEGADPVVRRDIAESL